MTDLASRSKGRAGVGRQRLLTPTRLGGIELSNRAVMAPMTRNRALANGAPGRSAALYYAQRASAGLIVSEGVCVSAQAVGGAGVPGIWSEAQVAGWEGVVDAVHRQGGRIVLQLWHTGRASHPRFQPSGADPVGPSAVAIDGRRFRASQPRNFVTPRALGVAEVPGIVADFAHATANALRAGFDGVEIHGANGYLIDQFLHSGSNRRDDAYGGSAPNRVRFLSEVVEAVGAVADPSRVGVRLSPSSVFNDMSDDDPSALYEHVLEALSTVGLAYLHLIEPRIAGSVTTTGDGLTELDSRWVRERWAGPLVAAGNYDGDRAERALRNGQVDAVAFGRRFLANPDLPERLATGAALNAHRRETFYGGGDDGYIDYPSIEALRAHERLLAETESGPAPGIEDLPPLGPATPHDAWPLAWAADQIRDNRAMEPLTTEDR